MQRQLIVMRHAKSSWADASMGDHERPLNDRGCRDAPRIARRLAELDWVPQFVLSSDARRTTQTSKLMLAVWDEGIEASYVDRLYLAGSRELADELVTLSDEVESLLVMGHNPGWERVVRDLTGTDVIMKTATAALLTATLDSWADAFSTPWSIADLLYPKELV